jgi:hypothetical protein
MSTVTNAVQCSNHLEWATTHRFLCKNQLVLKEEKQKVLIFTAFQTPIEKYFMRMFPIVFPVTKA